MLLLFICFVCYFYQTNSEKVETLSNRILLIELCININLSSSDVCFISQRQLSNTSFQNNLVMNWLLFTYEHLLLLQIWPLVLDTRFTNTSKRCPELKKFGHPGSELSYISFDFFFLLLCFPVTQLSGIGLVLWFVNIYVLLMLDRACLYFPLLPRFKTCVLSSVSKVINLFV